MVTASLDSHMATLHGIYRSKVINKELLAKREPVVYKASQLATGTFHCPVSGCADSATWKWSLQQNFRL